LKEISDMFVASTLRMDSCSNTIDDCRIARKSRLPYKNAFNKREHGYDMNVLIGRNNFIDGIKTNT